MKRSRLPLLLLLLGMLISLILIAVFLPLGIAAGLILFAAVLVLAGIFLARRRNTDSSRPVLPGWPIIAGLVIPALALLAVVLIRSMTAQPPAACQPIQAASARPAPPPVSAQDYFSQGDAESDRGLCDQAIANYTRAIARKPDHAQAYNNRAYTHIMRQEYALALPDLDRAIQIRPNYVNALMNRADIHNFYYAIDYASALADYDRVIQLGAQGTSVCGHRLLALHHGWNLGTLAGILSMLVTHACGG
jgi:hypothetical protein